MNNKLLLINALTLLVRESFLKEKTPGSRPVELLKQVMAEIKGPVVDLTIDRETKMIMELKAMVLEMVSSDVEAEYSLEELLQRVQVITEPDPNLADLFREVILTEVSDDEAKKVIVRLTKGFKRFLRDKEAKGVINKFAAKIRFRPEEIGDMGKFISEMVAELEPYQSTLNDKDPAIVSEVSFEDLDAVADVFKKVKAAKQGGLAFITGWQALNRMLDGVGIRRGETVVVNALQGRNKSGICRSLFTHFCMYNHPSFLTQRKKAAIVLFSFEDEDTTIYSWFYRHLKEQETGQAVTAEELAEGDAYEMARYVRDKLSANGFVPIIHRVNPSDWTYVDIQNKLLSYEADGFEIMALFLDYLSLIPTTGCTQGPNGVDLRDLFRRMRNFTSARKISFITPHQLSTEAKLLLRQETLNFVQKVAGGGYTSGSRQIDQEVDTEICIHIEKVDGVSYQTFALGKRRDGELIAEKDRHFCMRFEKVGGLLPDLHTEDRSLPKPGALTRAELQAGGDQPFFLETNLEY